MQIITDSKGKISLKNLAKPSKVVAVKSSSKGPNSRVADKRDYFREFKNSLNSILTSYQNKKSAQIPDSSEPQNMPKVSGMVRQPSPHMVHNFSQKNFDKTKPEQGQAFVSLPKKKSKSTASLKTTSSAIFENYFQKSPNGPINQFSKRQLKPESSIPRTSENVNSMQNPSRPRRNDSLGQKLTFSSTNGMADNQAKNEESYTRPNFFKPIKSKAALAPPGRSVNKLINLYNKPSSVPRKSRIETSPANKIFNPTANANSQAEGPLKNFVTNIAQSKLVVNYDSPLPPQRAFSQKKFSKPGNAVARPYFFDDLIEAHTIAKGDNYFHSLFKTHMTQTLQSMMILSRVNLKEYKTNGKESVIESQSQMFKAKLPGSNPPISPPSVETRKTIIFDLDETLIHCNEDQSGPADLRVPVVFPSGEKILAGINVRPYAKEIIEELAAHFEVIIFTASHSCYANPVIDYLDDKKLIAGRLFREHCSQVAEGLYTKDLRVIKNRDLKDLVLVDNAAYSFILNLENGIPIIPFYNNKKDIELLKLRDFLLTLKEVEDVRPHVLNYFEWEQFVKHGAHPDKLFKKLFDN
jgi:Dullard-like phosphatase family protein